MGRFQYTGQLWIGELGMYHYRARIYSPTLGRFLQTDPIGYGDGMNLYAYVSNDPINFFDPLGFAKVCVQQPGSRISYCQEAKDEDGDGDTDSEDRHRTESDIRFIFANPDVFVGNSQEMITIDRIISQLNQVDSGKDADKRLNWLERNSARLAYLSNVHGMRDNISAIIRAFGEDFTQPQIDRIMTDILNGEHTTMANLRALGSINSTNITSQQFGIINNFVEHLPNTPLNQRVRAGWVNRWRSGR